MTAPQLAQRLTALTWMDARGRWHCEVTSALPANRYVTRARARVAIEDEIRTQNNRDILTGLTYIGERIEGALLTTHWREEDGT